VRRGAPPGCTPASIPFPLSQAIWRWRDISCAEEICSGWTTDTPAYEGGEERSVITPTARMLSDILRIFKYGSDIILLLKSSGINQAAREKTGNFISKQRPCS
jgi:hypothetical protein